MDKEVLATSLPGLEPSLFLENTGLSVEVYLKLLVKFAARNREKAAIIRAAHSQSDLAGLGVLVHTLKGSSAVIAATALQQACLKVEAAISRGADGVEVDTLIGELSLALDVVLISISSLA